MSLDFLQVREQIKRLGENAPQRARRLQTLRQRARQQLKNSANDLEHLVRKVHLVASNYDPNLRCALPSLEPIRGRELEALDSCFPLPNVPGQATILAADGSQITPDRHAPVNYCLINVGAIQMQIGAADAPEISIASQLLYDEELYTPTGMITDARLALMRDLNERQELARLAQRAPAPVITFTDGPMELWGAKDNDSEFQKSLDEYLRVLSVLRDLNVTTAGYVDKPAANLVVRLLEVAMLGENELPEIKKNYPLRGVIDKDLYHELLGPGERSAIFAIQSRSAQQYKDELGLHFFYLNVGQPDHPWLARVELPGWVAQDREMLDQLHAVLVQQCRIMGNRPYPYLLHRAHEAAVVSMEEKAQVTQMISLELRNRGVEVGEISSKQAAKDLQGRTKYER
ncbi:MAG: DNA double-strand break repair nuclease NurA [Chloroflexota bacterium]